MQIHLLLSAKFWMPALLMASMFGASAASAGSWHDPAQQCALYDRWGSPAGYDTDCLSDLGVAPRDGTYRPLRREGEILHADPYTYYCPVSANNGLGHYATTFTGSGFVSDVRDMPFSGRPCTPQPPQRVLPGID